MIGSAYKRMAAHLAERSAGTDKAFDGRRFRAALKKAREWYARGEGQVGTPGFSPYCALNRLMLDALLRRKDPSGLTRKVGEAARARFRDSRDYWDAMMPADAELTAAIFNRKLEDDLQAQDELERLAACYRHARASVIEDARSWDSVVRQVAILATLAHALKRTKLARRLRELSALLESDPTGAAGAEAPGGRAAAAGDAGRSAAAKRAAKAAAKAKAGASSKKRRR